MITLVLMNLVIAILSDKYEEVMAHRQYYEGRARLEKSLVYEKLMIAFGQKSNKQVEWHYLYVSKALATN